MRLVRGNLENKRIGCFSVGFLRMVFGISIYKRLLTLYRKNGGTNNFS